MALIVERCEGQVSLGGELSDDERFDNVTTDANIMKCRTELEVIIESNSGHTLQIDLAQLNVTSSMILSLLLCLSRAANNASCELKFVNMSRGLFDMARVGGIESFFPHLNH